MNDFIMSQNANYSGDGRTHGAPFRGYGYVPLRNRGNVVTRMGTQQQQRYSGGKLANEALKWKKSKKIA